MRSVAIIGWGVVLAGAAGVMALLPLFGLLGFESSFVLGCVAALSGAHLGARAAKRRRADASPCDGDAADARPLGIVLSLYAGSLATMFALLLPPLAILLANALRVKNCSLATGIGFFALLPMASAATGTAVGTASGLLLRRGGTALAIAAILSSVAAGLFHFYAAPPVFGFDPFVGWFPGSLYDEALAIEPLFLLARALHLLGVAGLVLLCAALLDGHRLRLGLRIRPRLLAAATLVLLLFALSRSALAPRLAPDARSIAAALGARRETAHLTLLYSPTGPWAPEIDLAADDAEFRYAQLARTLGVSPPRITCFLFDGAADKKRAIGAAGTQIAKPWRREIYLQHEPFPHPVLRHELAHVFAGEFGDPWFHVARRGPFFNIGLIEGVAVAAEDHPSRLTLDQQVKAMRALHLEPRLDRVFGLGFFGEAPARAYTAAGSFVQFLLERKGPDAIAAVYRAGGSAASWRAAYGEDFASLEAAWSRRIDDTPLDAREVSLAEERMRRPSVFHKTCAHELAVRREAARALSARGDHAGALAKLQSVCADEPSDPEPRLAVMDELAVSGNMKEAKRVARSVADDARASDAEKARALLFLGDAALREGLASRAPDAEARDALAAALAPARADDGAAADPDAADPAASYRRALALPLDEDSTRQLRARLLAVSDPRLGRPLAGYLVSDRLPRDPALDLLRAKEVLDAAPDQGIGHYLLGRMLFNHDRFEDAERELHEATMNGLPPGGFTVAAEKLQGLAALHARYPPATAASAFARILAEKEADPGALAEAKDLLDRCRFLAARR